jgi:hypothetical protein
MTGNFGVHGVSGDGYQIYDNLTQRCKVEPALQEGFPPQATGASQMCKCTVMLSEAGVQKHLLSQRECEILRLRHAKANAPLRYAQNDKGVLAKLGCSPGDWRRKEFLSAFASLRENLFIAVLN